MSPKNASQAELMNAATHCPGCHSSSIDALTHFVDLPALVCAEFVTAAEAKDAPCGTVALNHCENCDLIFNASYSPEKVSFRPGYSASLAHTVAFRQHVSTTAARLIDRYGLVGKSIFEIGCGDGYFLREICELGCNHGLGIDPTIEESRIVRAGSGSVRYVREHFSDRHTALSPDAVCSISVFETIPEPANLLRDVRRMLDTHHNAVVYFEVPNAEYMLNEMAIWSVYYEQFAHYTEKSLNGLFSRCGFKVMDSGPCYSDGQYLYVEAIPSKPCDPQRTNREIQHSDLSKRLRQFATRANQETSAWRERLDCLRREGRKVVAWGSGGKGNTFLKLADIHNTVRYVVDINPSRHGKFLPGMDKQIVGPDFLADYGPDTVIVTNPIYETEIRQTVASLGLDCDFLTL